MGDFLRDVDRVGDERVEHGIDGRAKRIGDQRVEYGIDGRPSRIGNDRVEYGIDGRAKRIGDQRVEYGIGGSPVRIGDDRLTSTAWSGGGGASINELANHLAAEHLRLRMILPVWEWELLRPSGPQDKAHAAIHRALHWRGKGKTVPGATLLFTAFMGLQLGWIIQYAPLWHDSSEGSSPMPDPPFVILGWLLMFALISGVELFLFWRCRANFIKAGRLSCKWSAQDFADFYTLARETRLFNEGQGPKPPRQRRWGRVFFGG